MNGPAPVLARAATAVGVTVVALLVLAWALQRKLIYLPDPRAGAGRRRAAARRRGGVLRHRRRAPAAGLVPAGCASAAGAAGPAVLVFNGNAGDRSARAPLAAALARAGISVLLFDYRGYGGNPGHPTETGLAADARAARGHLLTRPEVRPGSIVYFGESLGAAVARGLAVEHRPAALVLRSPFTSLADVGRVHYPYLPVRALLRDRYDPIGRVRSLDCPLLVVAGAADTIVPAGQSRRLHDAAAGPKRYVEIPGPTTTTGNCWPATGSSASSPRSPGVRADRRGGP